MSGVLAGLQKQEVGETLVLQREGWGVINLMDQPSYMLSSCVCSVKGVRRDKNQCVKGENKEGSLRSIMINLHEVLLCPNMFFHHNTSERLGTWSE